ncbi:hypothetical protein K438DRAFT_1954248 [Mycena galopus ATCC 62051]|nr:hypothetical protein K438DRAFT_1954248 [Mycena galopus ATCC 62051]
MTNVRASPDFCTARCLAAYLLYSKQVKFLIASSPLRPNRRLYSPPPRPRYLALNRSFSAWPRSSSKTMERKRHPHHPLPFPPSMQMPVARAVYLRLAMLLEASSPDDDRVFAGMTTSRLAISQSALDLWRLCPPGAGPAVYHRSSPTSAPHAGGASWTLPSSFPLSPKRRTCPASLRAAPTSSPVPHLAHSTYEPHLLLRIDIIDESSSHTDGVAPAPAPPALSTLDPDPDPDPRPLSAAYSKCANARRSSWGGALRDLALSARPPPAARRLGRYEAGAVRAQRGGYATYIPRAPRAQPTSRISGCLLHTLADSFLLWGSTSPVAAPHFVVAASVPGVPDPPTPSWRAQDVPLPLPVQSALNSERDV